MNDLVPIVSHGGGLTPSRSIADMVEARETLKKFVSECLIAGQDYDIIPGTDRRTLLQPGAQKVKGLFSLTHDFEELEVVQDWLGATYGEPFFQFRHKCILYYQGQPVGSGIGSCNSWEGKYRFRDQKRTCPACNQPAINKSSDRDEFYCWRKIGGCGAKFAGNDPRILEQKTGRIANPDIFDQVNTIEKMSQKRALVGAVLAVTGASDFFTQDMEDTHEQSNRIATGAPAETRGGADSSRNHSTRRPPPPNGRNGGYQGEAPPANTDTRGTAPGNTDLRRDGGDQPGAVATPAISGHPASEPSTEEMTAQAKNGTVSNPVPASEGRFAQKELEQAKATMDPKVQEAAAHFKRCAIALGMSYTALHTTDRALWVARLLGEEEPVDFLAMSVERWEKATQPLALYAKYTEGREEWQKPEQILEACKSAIHQLPTNLFSLNRREWKKLCDYVKTAEPLPQTDPATPPPANDPDVQRKRFFAMCSEAGLWQGEANAPAMRAWISKILTEKDKSPVKIDSRSQLSQADWRYLCDALEYHADTLVADAAQPEHDPELAGAPA